jgi:hypothetical protein
MAIVDTNSNFWIGGSGGINYIYSENSSWTAAALLEFGDVTYPGIFDFNGSVGIGVTTPQASLNILGANLDTTADLMFTYDSTGNYRNGIANSFYGGVPAWNHMDFLVSGGATTGSVNVMTLTGAGEVGIGTTVPNADAGYSPLTINGTSGGEIFLSKNGAIDGDIWADAGGIGLFSGVSMPIVFGPGGSEKMRITSAGYVGISNTSPSYLLHVGSSSSSGAVAGFQNSSELCTLTPHSSSPTWTCSSDIRLKKDIVDSGSGLAWLGDMRVRDFTMRDTGERQTGVIAQELQQTHPDMVHMEANGFYGVNSPNPWILVKAIQEQQGEIASLKAANDNLEKRLEALEHQRH